MIITSVIDYISKRVKKARNYAGKMIECDVWLFVKMCGLENPKPGALPDCATPRTAVLSQK